MNVNTVLYGILLLLVSVTGRHYGERSGSDSDGDERDQLSDGIRRARDHTANQMRHRRRSWQMNYGYDYPQPPSPFYPDNRRDYDKSQQDYLPQILRLLEEIAAFVKRPPPPPPPPQPIYVPYPVAYPIPQYCNCNNKPTDNIPNVTVHSRFPVMDDTNQNWGFVTGPNDIPEEEGDGSRPISFDPIKPKRRPSKPQIPVEHGTAQGQSFATPAPNPESAQSQTSARAPNMCDLASLSCCTGTQQDQKACFTKVGCAKTYNNGNGCNKELLLSIIDAYSQAYAPAK